MAHLSRSSLDAEPALLAPLTEVLPTLGTVTTIREVMVCTLVPLTEIPKLPLSIMRIGFDSFGSSGMLCAPISEDEIIWQN
jgi:hypothetical protein